MNSIRAHVSSSSTPTAPEAPMDMSIWADVAWCSLLPISRDDALGLRSDEKRKLAAIAFSRGQTLTKRNQLAMTKLGISVGILATVSCLSAGAQTINVMALDQARSPDGLASCEGERAAAECALGNRRSRRGSACFPTDGWCPPSKRGPRHREGTNGDAATTVDGGDRG
jgi:hypothetical protein